MDVIRREVIEIEKKTAKKINEYLEKDGDVLSEGFAKTVKALADLEIARASIENSFPIGTVAITD